MSVPIAKPFEAPAGWPEQVAACPACQGYKTHKAYLGVCNTHRPALWEAWRHHHGVAPDVYDSNAILAMRQWMRERL